MHCPFPGMDPYLESPFHWSDFHGSFIPAARQALQPQLPARYRARISERILLEAGSRPIIPDVTLVEQRQVREGRAAYGTPVAPPDEPVLFSTLLDDFRETYLTIEDRQGNRVVTVIELLSPTNKRPGEWRDQYLRKRKEAISGGANLVEIDLLREGVSLARDLDLQPCVPSYSVICVWRAAMRGYEGYFVELPRPLPNIRVPLLPEDGDVRLDIQAVFTRCYDDARYDLDIDYRKPPAVELSPDDAAWCEKRLLEKGLRPELSADS